jgi:PAS domain S-box-containing protein
MNTTTTILIVDDTLDLLELYSVWLREAGYKVLQAATGRECLCLVAEQLPDLVLLDVMLPDLDGIEVCKTIKSNEQTAAIPVINVSGKRTSADNEAEGLEAGADGYLTKPFDARTLLAHVKALLRMRQTEEALKRSEERFRAAFDNALDAMLITDDNAHYVDANPSACAMFGVSREEMLQRKLSDFVEPGRYGEAEKAWQTFVEEGEQSGNFRLYRPDGTTRELEYRAKARFLPNRHLSILRDVTQRKQAEEELRQAHDELEKRVAQRTAELVAANVFLKNEIAQREQASEALRESEEQYRELVENLNDIIYATDDKGLITYISQAVERTIGLSASDIMGQPFTKFLHPEDELFVLHNFQQSAAGISNALEFRVVDKAGGIRWVRKSSRPVFHGDRFMGTRGLVTDITERKHAEASRMQLLRRLVTAQEEEQLRLSRELHDQTGQSLAALMLGLKSIEDSDQLRETARNRLRQLQELTNQLAHDVHNLAANLRPTALEDLGLHTALSNYLEEWSDRTKIRADFHCNGLMKERLPRQIETAVYRIVQEALTNVVKHADAQNVSVILEYRGNRVQAIIEDDGIGFDAERMLNATNEDRRLGLIGMQERVALLEGDLNIESTPDSGTTVIIHIPV